MANIVGESWSNSDANGRRSWSCKMSVWSDFRICVHIRQYV